VWAKQKHVIHSVFELIHFKFKTANTKAVGTVMSNNKEIPEVSFLVKLKKKRKTDEIKWLDVQDFYLLSTAHDDLMDETLKAKGFHKKTKPNTAENYDTHRTGVNKSDQILFYYAFK
jgi:hypothetical protein